MRFGSEEEFEAYYNTLTSPSAQLRELAEWRRFQIKIVSKFIDQIRLIADEQYSDIDHFLLELLQNADDNDYSEQVTPRVVIELAGNSLTLDNNESGFDAANLYAITYAAASTKIRRKSAATYIGEKGIGFKSVFAVADHVEIHSGPYHFRLNNGEFIVPHEVAAEDVTGTRIRLRFKQGRGDMAALLSQRLERVGSGPREFTMFLRKVRELQIDDRFSNRTHFIKSGPEGRAGFWRVECNGVPRRYFRGEYSRTIPGDVVETRFRDLKDDLPRQIDLVVPVPNGTVRNEPDEGHLFCFLPTHVAAACPVRIQADAKTTTNRENIQSFGASPWNRRLFEGLAEDLIDFYRQLTRLEEFKLDLPTCWPIDVSSRDVGNEDLKAILAQVERNLGNHPLVLDRHGEFRCASQVRLLPERFANWLSDDACEAAVSGVVGEPVTFVDATWARRHRTALTTVGVRELSTDELLGALACDFAVRTVPDEEQAQRSFLDDVMALADQLSYQAAKLKPLPIFPVRVDERLTWTSLSADVFWVQSDSPKVSVPGNTPVVDPTFTYSPGGSSTRTPEGERVRQFNVRFRNFLSQTLAVPHHDELQLLRRTVVRELKTASGDLSDPMLRRKVNQAWARLFARAWKRQRTIINDLGQKSFDEFIAELKKCRVPVRAIPKTTWQLVEVSRGFLGKPFNPEGALDKVYASTGALFIQLDLLEEKKPRAKKTKRKLVRVDWPEWRRFFEAIGLHSGPYFVYVDLQRNECLGSYQYKDGANTAFPLLKAAVDSAVSGHVEFSGERASSYSIHSPSRTVGLDSYSLDALRRDQGHEFIGRLVSAAWHAVENYETDIRFIWGQKYTTRHASTRLIALFDQLRAVLKLDATLGLHPPGVCFVASAVNQQVLGSIAPLVQAGAGGYAPGMLSVLGVRGDVVLDDIDELIQQWAANAPEGADFAPMLEAVCRYLEACPHDAAQAEYRLKFFDPERGELRPVLDWLTGSAPLFFDVNLVSRLRDRLGRSLERDAGTLAALLFEIGDVRVERDAFFRALSDLGRRISVEGGAGALRVFESRLSEVGVLADGKKVDRRQDLPVVWDINPAPTGAGQWLLPESSAGQRSYVSGALQALGWPCLSSLTVRLAEPRASRTPDSMTTAVVSLSVQEVTKRISANRPDIGARLHAIGLLSTATAVSEGLRYVDELQVLVKLDSGEQKSAVPFWRQDGCLFVDSGFPLDRALAEYIDRETGATTSAFFDLIWQWAQAQARVEPGQGGPATPSPRLGGGGAGGEGSDGGSGSGSGGNSGTERPSGKLGPERGGTNVGGDGASDPGKEDKDPDGPRRRLCSFVTRAPGGDGGGDRGSSPAGERNMEVEEAGRARMVQYFQAQGAQIISREKDNVGYDFEVTVGGKTIYIELKSSRDRWQGWEHALTRNEFIQAFSKRDDYYLCAVDRALSDDWKIYFIADPAGLVDEYVFDDPWKEVAVDMNERLEEMRRGDDLEEV